MDYLGFPINSMVIFHGELLNNQSVINCYIAMEICYTAMEK